MSVEICGAFISWWDGEYEGECELPLGHDGPHDDGLAMRWIVNEDGEEERVYDE